MIESCPKKRMLLGITFLGILTVIVLIVESHWTESRSRSRKPTFFLEQNSSCWQKEKFEVVKECEPCTDFEIASKSIRVCVHTQFKEVLRCANGETVTRSCDKAIYLDERTFWRFEAFMLLFSLMSSVSVFARKKVLHKRLVQRVHRQIINSV